MSTIRQEWRSVAAAMMIYMLLMGATYSSFGLFVVPVSAEFGLSRANMNTALILLNFGNAALAPLVGMMLDRLPLKRIVVGCTLLLGASLAGLALSRAIWISAIILAVPLAVALGGAGMLTVSVFLARRFSAHRGRAMALAAIGLSLGGITIAPVVGLFIDTFGWRTALLLVAGAVTLLLLLVTLMIPEAPSRDSAESASSAAAGKSFAAATAARPISIRELLAVPQFWAIGIGASLAFGVTLALSITMVPLALKRGLSTLQAASLVSVGGGAAIAGQLILAVVADKLNRVALTASLIAIGIIPNAMLLLSESYPLLLVSAILMGFMIGTQSPVLFALIADKFGTVAFGTVRGSMSAITAMMCAAAARFAGEVFDRTGGYDVAFSVFIAAEILAVILILSVHFMRPVGSRSAPAAAPLIAAG